MTTVAVTEEARHDMYEGLTEVLGKQRATTLMEHLPPTGWGDVATTRDLEVLQAVTRAEMAELKTELKAEMAELRVGLEALRAEMHKGFNRTLMWAVGANSALLGVAVTILKMS
jgi:hypothetical protein